MKTNRLFVTLVLFVALILAGCNPGLKVGALKNETKSVERDDASSVRVNINFGAGVLNVTGDAENLLDANFTYNVARLKPDVKYTDGTLVVSQPDTDGMPAIPGVTDFRNEWGLHLGSDVPMQLSVDVGAGTSNLNLSGLSLSGLAITLGAAQGTIDLSGDWARNLDVTIDAGASNITVLLPKDVGVHVVVDRGPTVIDAQGLTHDGNVYTNAAYSGSGVTMHIDLKTGVGIVSLLETE